MESLFDIWSRRDPEWETRYQESIMDVFCDYGKGRNSLQSARGKYFGAGYEMFIIAFFIGLYFNQTKPLVDDKAKRKHFGWAIQKWGNIEFRLGRCSYEKIQKFMFAALVARTDIDLISLDKGLITNRKVVDQLMDKMEQYANFGFSYILERMEDDPNCFFKETGFLHLFLSFINNNSKEDDDNILEDL